MCHKKKKDLEPRMTRMKRYGILDIHLPDEDALKALIGARSGFCKTRNILFKPVRMQVTTNLLINPPDFSLTLIQKLLVHFNFCVKDKDKAF